jgi:5-methylcytosine-specific restriction protein A
MPSLPKTLGRSPNQPPTPRAPDNRPDATQRGYSYRWKKYARAFLARFPICRNCEVMGRSTLATLVDHIIPITDAGEADPNFWPEANHQPLCFRCHAKKTAADRRKGLTR